MSELIERRRDSSGRWLKGVSGNPRGRLPRVQESEFYQQLNSLIGADDWRQVVEKALEQAKLGDSRAREWLGRYLMGEPAQIHEYLSGQASDIRLTVVFVGRDDERCHDILEATASETAAPD